MNRKFLVGLLVLFSFASKAQVSTCSEVLESANDNFESGHFYGIPAKLKPCLDNGFNKNEKIQAYWLLTRTYLFIDDPISAEDSYLKLLRLDPEYFIDEERDPVDIVYLSTKFTTTPIFVVFAKAGLNFTGVSVIHNFGVDNTLTSFESYKNKIGFNLGAGGEFNITDKYSIGLEFLFQRQNYDYRNILFTDDQLTLTEKLTVVSAPVYFKYRFNLKKFQPNIYVGFSNELILLSNASVRLLDRVTNPNDENTSEFPVTGPDVELTNRRNDHNMSVLAGIGSSFRIGYNYIFIDVRYSKGITNIVDIDNQYGNNDINNEGEVDELIYKYGYVDDYKRLDHIAVSIGFVKPLYKPRKIQPKKNNIFNKIFK